MDVIDQATGESYAVYHGDCVEVVGGLPSDSVHYSIFSPPFASLYTYSNSPRDMGNCKTHDEFFKHFGVLVPDLLRVTMPGRLLSFHCMNLPTVKSRDGVIGLADFRGGLIRAFVEAGWIYHSEVCIWKDPVTAMQRTKALGLLHKQLKKDSCMSRQGIPDYVVTMRKPGDNPERVEHTNESFPVREWQEYASPIWTDINPSDTLQYRSARENEDERHICLAAGSLVLTRDGYVSIEDVAVGDEVLTHRGRWRPVVAKQCNGLSDVVEIAAQGVASLVCTPDHMLYARVASGSRAKETAMKAAPAWVCAAETLGSYLNLKLPPEEDSDLTEKECWIVGRWLGDGHRGVLRPGHGEHAPIIISCAHSEATDLVRRLGEHAGASQQLTARQIVVRGLRKGVKRVIDRCGKGAANKRVPAELLSLPGGKARALLAGYLSADGHYVELYDRCAASSISRALLLGMAIVAQRAHGVVASVYAGRGPGETTIEGRRVSTRQDWIFSYRQTDGYRKSGWVDDESAWKKVRRIEDVGRREVWDLQVEEDESFTAEGCIVHNCPLQLEVIRRALRMWSNEGDTVLSPFMGIGSEGYVAVCESRRFVGVELKKSYYEQAVRNLASATTAQGKLFA